MALLTGALLAFAALHAVADGYDDAALQRVLGNAVVTPIAKSAPLRLTSNKDQLIRLNEDAATVIVNNPAHATVLLDSPRLLIIMPREPGVTSFSVLNARGDVILSKEVIVSNVQPQYVRIRRMCNSADASCVPSAYFYCPDGCYEVTPVASGGASPASAPPPAATPGQPPEEFVPPQTPPQAVPLADPVPAEPPPADEPTETPQ